MVSIDTQRLKKIKGTGKHINLLWALEIKIF